MKNIISVMAVILLAGCVTLSGDYQAFAFDAEGNQLNENVILTASGSGIYTLRNAVCHTYPEATLRIIDLDTGKELEGESPYHCH
jgi:hypothetical protein